MQGPQRTIALHYGKMPVAAGIFLPFTNMPVLCHMIMCLNVSLIGDVFHPTAKVMFFLSRCQEQERKSYQQIINKFTNSLINNLLTLFLI